MKRFGTFSFLVFTMIIVFLSCSKDKEAPTYWYSYGTYYESDESTLGFIFKLDNGQQLIPTEASGLSSDIADTSRFFLEYVKIDETEETLSAKITGAQAVLTKNVMQLTTEIADSIGYDRAILSNDNIWFSDYHMNIAFSYYGNNPAIQHYINVVKPINEKKDENGRHILEFKHNANGDLETTKYTGVISINMLSLYEPDMDSINFALKWVDYYNDTNTIESTFYYKGENNSLRIATPEFVFNNVLE